LHFPTAALCTILAFAICASAHADTTKLQWGHEPNPFRKQKQSSTGSALRFVKPGIASTQHNAAPIKLAAYEDDSAPRLTSGRDAEAIRSVVVNRGDLPDDFRAAQLPPPAPDASGANPPTDDMFRAPFGERPDEPAPLDTPPMPEAGATQPMGEIERSLPPPDEGRAAQPTNNFPQFDQQRPAPDAGQFQPILPSGPGPDQSPPTQMTPAEKTKIEEEGERAKESCEESLKNLREYTVDKVNLNIVVTGTEGEDFPFECTIDDGTMFSGRCWEQITYMWKASAMCHKPLYFEDEQLERYGHSFSPCFQPFVSGAHFFTRPFILPYCMGVEPPCECVYALGHYRPGNCAPYMCNPIPLSPRGALFQAGAVTGTAAILP
jgi:hypothetical protein